MHIYMIDAERLGPVENDKQQVRKERCFVEAETIAGAIALRPEDDDFEIVCVQRIGNIIARESTDNTTSKAALPIERNS
jgi:hypothetical protein